MRSQRTRKINLQQVARYVPILMIIACMALGCNFPVEILDQITASSSSSTQISTTAPDATPSPTTGPSPTATSDIPSPDASPTLQALPPDVLSKMQAIESQVMELRGLYPNAPTRRRLLTEDEMQRVVIDEITEGYSSEDAADDARVMELLGFLEPGFDLWTLYLDLYSEQVLGFYDDETEKMTVLSNANFDILAQFTYAHEYDHFLQDHTFDFKDDLHYDDAFCEANGDRCLAVQALFEGDAVLLQTQWLRIYASQDEIADLLEITSSIESPVFSTAPEFIQQSLVFPYDQGLEFVLHFHLKGQWASVDDIYRDPPASTEQILHPEKYPDDIPVVLEVPDLAAELGPDWRQLDRDILGEWQLKMMLSEYLLWDVADTAAKGWGGDTYIALHNDAQDRSAIVLIITWDTDQDATQYYEAMREYGDTRFTDYTASGMQLIWQTGTHYASLMRGGNQTLWILAPDEATEAALRSAFTFPVRQQ
jgi:hypothetical protein